MEKLLKGILYQRKNSDGRFAMPYLGIMEKVEGIRSEEAIEEAEHFEISRGDQFMIAEAILNPTEPNEALKKAFERRAQLFGDERS